MVTRTMVPDLSVILCSYNRAATLRRCLEALEQQTLGKERFEVICVNDGSTDDTRRVMQEALKRLHGSYHEHPENRGLAAARNTGLKAAQGRLVLFINDDTYPEPDLLEQHRQAHERHGNARVAILGHIAFAPEHAERILSQALHQYNLLFPLVGTREGVPYGFDHFVTANLSVARQAFVSGKVWFDETFRRYGCEDIEVGYRLWQCGYRVYYHPQAKVIHDHRLTVYDYVRREVANNSNLVQFVDKHPELIPHYFGTLRLTEATLAEWRQGVQQLSPYIEKLIKEIATIEDLPPRQLAHFTGSVSTPMALVRQVGEALVSIRDHIKRQAVLQTLDELPEVRYRLVAGGMTPRVSVIIPCYNYGRYLTEAVESVIQQTYQDFEIIIVNDGSTDNTQEVAEALLHRYPHHHIRLINQENSGQPAISRNRGIAEAQGEYILCLDADDKIAPHFLESCVKALEDDPRIGIAYPDQQNFGDRSNFEPHPEYNFTLLTRFNFIPSCSLFRKGVWEEVGGFATNVIGYEDWDFWISCGERGYRGQHIPEAIWYYRIHGDGLYARQKAHDQRLKAQVVLNHPRVYTPAQRRWAEEVLRGEPRALALDGGLGVVPDLPENTLLPERAEQGQEEPGEGCSLHQEQPLHILFTMYGWAEEGGGTMLPRQVAKALVKRGHRVSVIYTPARRRPDKPAYYVEEGQEDGVRLFGIYNRPALFYDLEHPEREVDDPAMRRIVAGLIADLKPDIVHYHSLLNFSMGVPEEVRQAGIPSVYTSHNYWPLCPRMYLLQDDLTLCSGPSADGVKCAACIGRFDKQADYALRAERGRLILSHSIDRHLAPSQRVRQLFIQNGHEASRIHVLPQQPETVDRIWQQVGAVRQPKGPLTYPLKVGFLGSLLPLKGVHILVKALQVFQAGQVEGHLYGTGPEGYVNALRQMDQKGLVWFHGRYEPVQLPHLLSQLDVVAIPSLSEDCAPLSGAEALAARVPVVGSRIGGIPEFIEDGVNGFLVDPRDAAGLASVLYRFLSDPALLGRMQQRIQPPKGFHAYLDELLTHYYQVIAEHCQKRSQPLCVVWEGSQFVHHSLALVNRELCLRLIDAGNEISILPYEPDQFDPETDQRFHKLAERIHAPLSRPADVHVRHQWPPTFTPPPEGHWVIIQPWEFGSLPKPWVEVMSTQVDEIWVPSTYVRNCYIKSGVPADRVHVVPNGVDPERFHPETPPLDLARFGLPPKGFRFLFVGGTIWRKGIDLLLQAYLKTFTRTDDVSLVIKDMGGRSFYRGQTFEQEIRRLQAMPEAPPILYLDQDLLPDQLPGLYTACDCLVHPYRGEGFGLPIAEAMACGLPVIVTNYGAALDFCDAEVAYLIPAPPKRLPERRIGDLETVDFPWLAEPDGEALARLMREVYENPEGARTKGRKASQRIRTDFTWERAAEKAMVRLRVLRDRPIRRYQHPPTSVPKVLQEVERLKAEGDGKLENGDLEGAIRSYREALRRNPSSWEAALALGAALMKQGALQEAAEQFHQALRLNPSSPDVLNNVGCLFLIAGRVDDAERCFRNALSLDPNHPDACWNLAVLLQENGGRCGDGQERWTTAPTQPLHDRPE